MKKFAVLAIVALFAAACGSDSDDSATEGTEVIAEADLVITMRDGQIDAVKDRLTRVATPTPQAAVEV